MPDYKKAIKELNRIAAQELGTAPKKSRKKRGPNILKRVKRMRKEHPEMSYQECYNAVIANLKGERNQ